MAIIYFDAFAGASGDMILGALVDCGLSLKSLSQALATIPLEGYSLNSREVKKGALRGTKVTVEIADTGHHHRRLPDILQLLRESGLSPGVKEKAARVFQLLATAEGKVHGIPPEKVHFHEVGAVDSIVDITGVVAGLEMLKVDRVYCSPLPLGTGYLQHSHGTLPLPAPATAEILALCRIPSTATSIKGETVTPTGAVLLGSLAGEFGPMPAMVTCAVGYGAGTADRDLPNLLRAFLGEPVATAPTEEEYVLLQANIDDMNPEYYDYIFSLLFNAGADDVYLTPLLMKKGRPAVELSVLTDIQKESRLSQIILTETTSLGLRVSRGKKKILARRWEQVDTPLGRVRIKLGLSGDKIVNFAPEYEDCRRLAEANNLPLKEIYTIAVSAFLNHHKRQEKM